MLFHKLFNVQIPGVGDPLNEAANSIGTMFTYLVDVLRVPENFPNAEVNALMQLTWRLVGNKITPVGMAGNIPSMHFYIEATCKASIGVFCCPEKWVEQCTQKRIHCMGGLVWASSQARDFWNKRYLIPNDPIHKRAKLYEAEFLLTMKNLQNFQFNEYQKSILEEFPEGLESARELLYHPRVVFLDAS